MKRILSSFSFLAVLALPLRAQVTETPQTIAPGKFFVRMDAVTVGVNRDSLEPYKYTALGLASSILSTGVTSNLDVQIGAQVFVRETYQYQGTNSTRSGWGDLSFRTKWEFWRDDELGQSVAVIPYIKIPSRAEDIGNNHLEGGFIVPWAMKLGTGSEAGAMFEWDQLRNNANDGYDSHWLLTAFAKQKLVAGFAAYAETTMSVSSASSSTFAGTLGGGVTFDFSKFFQADYGLSRGVGGASTDWIGVVRLRWSF